MKSLSRVKNGVLTAIATLFIGDGLEMRARNPTVEAQTSRRWMADTCPGRPSGNSSVGFFTI